MKQEVAALAIEAVKDGVALASVAVRAASTQNDAACASDEVLAARAADRLGPDDRERVDAHLASCETCRVVLAEVVRSAQTRPQAPTLGRYVLEEQLGAGGMGEVWSAWDPDVDRRVAVKLLHDRGANDAARAQRFLAERQILGALVHPNIARLLDAGTTPEGRAWFAMERVDGLPIDAWATQRNLDVRARVALMLHVCAAVGHAHTHLVVHRDLKPSNILVTSDGAPRLVDFGIAKLLHDGAALTQTGVVPMTPAYASPEQVSNAPVTTVSDVYSLGVVLYELLAGQSPYRVAAGDTAALMTAVRDAEPLPPTSGRDRDLDAIALMALRKFPRDRYPSVAALADDLRAWLEGRPTVARKGSRAHRAVKFVRRHKALVSAASAALVALIAGLAATLWQARAAARERDLAQQRFAEVRSLARAVVFDYHDGIAALPGSTPLREQLVKDALTYLHSLARSASGDVALQLELAQALLKIGDVQGDPFAASLGHTAEARASYLEAQGLVRGVLKVEPAHREALRAAAQTHEKLGALLEVGGSLAEAVAEYQTARGLYAQVLAQDPNDLAAENAIGLQDISSGQVNTQLSKLDEAEAQLQRAIAVRAAIAQRTRAPEHRRGLAVAWLSLSKVMHERMKNAEELALLEQGERELADVVRENPGSVRFRRDLDSARGGYAQALIVAGRGGEAVGLMQKTVETSEATLAADPKNAVARRDVVVALSTLADVYKSVSRSKEAIAPIERALVLNAELGADDPENQQLRQDRVFLHLNLGRAQTEAGLFDAAAAQCQQAIDLTEAMRKQGVQDLVERAADGWTCFVDLYAERRPADALVPATRALALLEEANRAAPSTRLLTNIASVSVMHGGALMQLKRWADGDAAFTRAVAAFEQLQKENAVLGDAKKQRDAALAGQTKCRAMSGKR